MGRERRQGEYRGERERRVQRHPLDQDAHAQGESEDQQKVRRQRDVGDAQPRHEDRHRQGEHRRGDAGDDMAHAGRTHQSHASHALHQNREGRPPAEVVEPLRQPRQQWPRDRRRQRQPIQNGDREPFRMVEDRAPQRRPRFAMFGERPPRLHMLDGIVGNERERLEAGSVASDERRRIDRQHHHEAKAGRHSEGDRRRLGPLVREPAQRLQPGQGRMFEAWHRVAGSRWMPSRAVSVKR